MKADVEVTAPAWNVPKVTRSEVRYATMVCFLAWVFAVYDFILFGTLLPKVGDVFGWDPARQAGIATWISAGTVLVALTVGPVVDRLGRRAGVMFTVGGAAVFSALTALAGLVGVVPLILIRSFAGLGYAEQGVNGAYLSELYASADSKETRERGGLIYAIVQGGWPVGALLAALLSALLLPALGWRGVFLFAAVPSAIVAIMASRLRESPHFQVLQHIRKLRAHGSAAEADAVARAHDIALDHRGATYSDAFKGAALRPTVVLTLTHVLGWMPVMIFGVLGTSVITSVHGISFQNSLFILFLSNAVAFVGYIVHGFLGDRFGRRNVIAGGWLIGACFYIAMLFGPSDFVTVVTLYSIGNFFLIGPYSCVLFFVGESFPTTVRGTGAAIVVGIGPVGSLIASYGATQMLGGGSTWQAAALAFGAIPCLLSAATVLFARNVRSVTEADRAEAAALPHPARP